MLNNRFTVFDLKDVPINSKLFVRLILLDYLWSWIKENYQKDEHAWLYISDIQYVLRNEQASRFFSNIWKRSRVWGCGITGIVKYEDSFLEKDSSRIFLSNSPFIQIFGCSESSIERLSELMAIPQRILLDLVYHHETGKCILLDECGNMNIINAGSSEDTEMCKLTFNREKKKKGNETCIF